MKSQDEYTGNSRRMPLT